MPAVEKGRLYAALAFDPPVGFVSVVPELPPLPVSDGVFFASSLLVPPLSPDSVFAGDFASLEPDFDSEDEGLLEP